MDTLFACDAANRHRGRILALLRGDDEVCSSPGRNGGQMGDDDDLTTLAEAVQLAGNCKSRCATDAGVHLVEHHGGDLVGLRKHGLEREHDTRKLSTGSDLSERTQSFPWVGSDQELDHVQTGLRCSEPLIPDSDTLLVDALLDGTDEPGIGHGQLSKLFFYLVRKNGSPLLAFRGQCCA